MASSFSLKFFLFDFSYLRFQNPFSIFWDWLLSFVEQIYVMNEELSVLLNVFSFLILIILEKMAGELLYYSRDFKLNFCEKVSFCN